MPPESQQPWIVTDLLSKLIKAGQSYDDPFHNGPFSAGEARMLFGDDGHRSAPHRPDNYPEFAADPFHDPWANANNPQARSLDAPAQPWNNNLNHAFSSADNKGEWSYTYDEEGKRKNGTFWPGVDNVYKLAPGLKRLPSPSRFFHPDYRSGTTVNAYTTLTPSYASNKPRLVPQNLPDFAPHPGYPTEKELIKRGMGEEYMQEAYQSGRDYIEDLVRRIIGGR